MLSSLTASGRLKSRIKWVDHGNEENKEKLITNDPTKDLIHKEETNIQPVNNHKRSFSGRPVLKNKIEQIKMPEIENIDV